MENLNKYNDEHIRKEAPTLFGMNKDLPEVPIDFFENLPGDIMERIQNETKKKTGWRAFFSNRVIQFGSFGTALGILVVGVLLFSNENKVTTDSLTIVENTTPIEFNEEEIEAIADVELDENDIIEYYSEVEEIAVPVMEICECDVDEMIDYIYEVEIDTDLLINILEEDESITI